MTTHDQRTDVTGSYDESQFAVQASPATDERTQSQQPAEFAPPTQAPEGPAFSDTETAGPEAHPGEAAAPVQHSHAAGQSSTGEMLFADAELTDLRARWAGVQAAFVDDPKDCVQKADVLVSDLVDQLTTGFTQARSRLEEQWARGEDASTEDLRLALMHYREFFERLLAV